MATITPEFDSITWSRRWHTEVRRAWLREKVALAYGERMPPKSGCTEDKLVEAYNMRDEVRLAKSDEDISYHVWHFLNNEVPNNGMSQYPHTKVNALTLIDQWIENHEVRSL